MRVADFFCGAGGFSEGFRIAGFDVVFGLDNWKPAIETHQLNHPEAAHHLGDILKIAVEDIDSVVPDTEVIAGSPPCVSFSYSNKAGKADKSLGVALIEKYLQIVAYKKHKKGSKLKYWLMENVPNSADYVKDSYTFEELGLPGGDAVALEVKTRNIFNAADFGAPQTRTRFVCGDYPVPSKSVAEGDRVTMRQVLDALGDPLDEGKATVKDVAWAFKTSGSDLTDHRYDTRVEEFEWKNARRQKEDHGFMGKMSFPEYLDRPSRTVMATQSAVSRESILFGTGEAGVYRLPTIREIACFMSFPATYQFEAGSEAAKYRLVGNAVCPKLSFALGRAIADAEGLPESKPVFKSRKPSIDLTGTARKKSKASRKISAKFQMHVPYLKVRSMRVDLDNIQSDFDAGKYVWRVVLHRGSGKKALNCTPKFADVKRSMRGHGLEKLEAALIASFGTHLPSASAFQQAHLANGGQGLGPEKALTTIKIIVDQLFPEKEYADIYVPGGESTMAIGREDLPIRVAAALYACLWLVNGMGQPMTQLLAQVS